MRPLHFPPDVRAKIEHDRFHHPVPQIQRRMGLLRLAAHGLPRPDLICLSGLSKATGRVLGRRAGRRPPLELPRGGERPGPAHRLTDTLQPLLKRAAAGSRRVFLAAAYFVRGSFMASLWCLVRWVMPSGAGRQPDSVLGALDATTRTLIRETTDGAVTHVTAGRLLLNIRAAHPTGRITVVWDNARYQHTSLVRAVAALTRIDLVSLPPYSPILNLIERVWKFVKKTALANRSIADYAVFKAAIDGSLDRLGSTHRDAMNSLLTLRFKTLHPASNSTAACRFSVSLEQLT